MSRAGDPRRLLEGGGEDGPLHDLLSAARDDLPSGAELERVWQRIGAPPPGPGEGGGGDAGPGGGASPGGGEGPGVDGEGPGAAAAGAGATAGVGTIAALIAAAGLAGGLVWAVARGASRGAPEATATAPAPAVAAMASAPRDDGPPPMQVEVASAPERDPSAASSAAAAHPREPAPAPSAAPAAAAPASAASASADGGPVPSEIDLLKKARAALAGDPGRALTLTDEAARLHPHGNLAQERQVVRIQALAGAGRRADAVAEARAFRDRHPDSAYARRLEALFPELGAP